MSDVRCSMSDIRAPRWNDNKKRKRMKEVQKQISKTQAESQQIVTQRPLSCVQYPVLYLSRIQRICLSRYLNLLFSIICAQFYLSPALLQCYDLGPARRLAYSYSCSIWKSNISPLSSMNSGLEAFSRNSTRGSFSALTFQSTELPIT